jgi:hypothetical protein
MASRHIKVCDGCGRSTGQTCEVWTLGRKEYCSRRCLNADRLKAESGKLPSRAYLALAFALALLTFAFVATPRARAQDNRHLHHAHYYCKCHHASSAVSSCNGKETKDGQTTRDWSYDSGSPLGQLVS